MGASAVGVVLQWLSLPGVRGRCPADSSHPRPKTGYPSSLYLAPEDPKLLESRRSLVHSESSALPVLQPVKGSAAVATTGEMSSEEGEKGGKAKRHDGPPSAMLALFTWDPQLRGSCCIYRGNQDILQVRLPIRAIPICGELTLSPTVTVTENKDVIFFFLYY